MTPAQRAALTATLSALQQAVQTLAAALAEDAPAPEPPAPPPAPIPAEGMRYRTQSKTLWTRVLFIAGVAWGTEYIGPMRAA